MFKIEVHDPGISFCDCCLKEIDRFNQLIGYYIVHGNDIVCSEDCLKEILGNDLYNKAIEEWDEDGDSEIFYWSYDEEETDGGKL